MSECSADCLNPDLIRGQFSDLENSEESDIEDLRPGWAVDGRRVRIKIMGKTGMLQGGGAKFGRVCVKQGCGKKPRVLTLHWGDIVPAASLV